MERSITLGLDWDKQKLSSPPGTTWTRGLLDRIPGLLLRMSRRLDERVRRCAEFGLLSGISRPY